MSDYSQEFPRFWPRNGRTIKEAAEITGLSERTIRRWTSEPREVWLAKAAQRREKIRALRAKGLTMREIAEIVGCSAATVCASLKRDD